MSDIVVRVKSFIPTEYLEDPLTGDKYEGDDRSFQYTSSKFRTRQQFTINVSTKSFVHARDVGESCLLDDNLNPVQCDTASRSGLTVENIQWYSDRVTFKAIGSVANPLVSYSAALDYEFYFTVYSNGTVCVYGDHDGCPNYEIYKKVGTNESVPLYLYDMEDAGKGITALAPPMDIHVSQRCF